MKIFYDIRINGRIFLSLISFNTDSPQINFNFNRNIYLRIFTRKLRNKLITFKLFLIIFFFIFTFTRVHWKKKKEFIIIVRNLKIPKLLRPDKRKRDERRKFHRSESPKKKKKYQFYHLNDTPFTEGSGYTLRQVSYIR